MDELSGIEDLRIEPFTLSDLDAMMEIEVVSFSEPWSRKSYEEIISLESVETWVAKIGKELVGYILIQYIVDELELHTFAVKSSWRRRGIGQRLLDHMLDRARAREVGNIFLLVRPNNVPARALYGKLGFKPVGVRYGYYRDTGEDALVMRLFVPNRKPGTNR